MQRDDKVGLYYANCIGIVGSRCWHREGGRLVNVNFRYVEANFYLFDNSDMVVAHRTPLRRDRVANVLPRHAPVATILVVDGSDQDYRLRRRRVLFAIAAWARRSVTSANAAPTPSICLWHRRMARKRTKTRCA